MGEVAIMQTRSVTADMAARFGMEVAAFEQTMRATVIPGNCTREQFAAFLLVAKQYGLNPLTREIFAFPAKGGGIFPVVSIDGWSRIINEQSAMDGLTFEDHREEGKIVAITARIHRKDRQFPVEVTEYMSECVRNTDAWKQWPARMLRHKATIQAARYAFGFAGIYDLDEAERMPAAAGLGGTAQQSAGTKSSSQCKKDGDDKWAEAQIEMIESAEEADTLRHQERWLSMPLPWREAYEEKIEKRLEEAAFVEHQRETDITAAIAAETP